MENTPLTITTLAITPQINNNQTQIIFQRHCNYDRNLRKLLPESKKIQKELVKAYISNLDRKDLENTYFLFTSSAEQNKDFNRCLDTTNIAMEIIKKLYQKKNLSLDHVINLDQTSTYKTKIHKSKDLEEKLSDEGKEQIADRAIHYINVLQRYAQYFHIKHPNSKLIIWNGTHYNFISALVKQRILNLENQDIINVKNCGGISLIIDESGEITANINDNIFPINLQYNKPHQKQYQK